MRKFYALVCVLILSTSLLAIEVTTDGFKNVDKKMLAVISRLEIAPLQAKAEGLLAVVALFAEKSPDIVVQINSGYMPWLKPGKEVNNADILMAAFIAGNIRPQIIKKVKQDHAIDGLKLMLTVYRTLRSDEKIQALPKLDSWSKFSDQELLNLVSEVQNAASTLVDRSAFVQYYNLGQKLQLEGKHEEALSKFLKVVELDPSDWQAMAKAIQECQALGRVKARDAMRRTLFALRKKGHIESLFRTEFYCRDQFLAGTHKVMTLEYFELKGDRAVRYSFLVLDDLRERVKFKVSLGSYEMTNTVAKAGGGLKEGQRLFHLDGYYPNGGHRTYGFFRGEPSYDHTRKMVIDILEGQRKSISSTMPTTKGLSIDLNE